MAEILEDEAGEAQEMIRAAGRDGVARWHTIQREALRQILAYLAAPHRWRPSIRWHLAASSALAWATPAGLDWGVYGWGARAW